MLDSIVRSAQRGSCVLLKDGTSCRIRPIGPADRALIETCFEGLSAESRRLRFFGLKPALSEKEFAFLTSADGRDHIALGAMRLDEQGRETEMLGAARCVRLEPGSQTSEMALAVVDAAQGCGIGTALLAQLVQAASAQGIRQFRCEVLAVNEGMRALALRLGSEARWLEDGVLEYHCDLPAPEETPEPAPVCVGDPFAVVKLGADAWSAGMDRLAAGALDLGGMALGAWFERLRAAWLPFPEPAGGLIDWPWEW